jgi:hypothetical protein
MAEPTAQQRAAPPRPTRKERRERRRAEERLRRLEASGRTRTTRYLSLAVVAVLLAAGVALAWGPLSGVLDRGAAARGQQFPNQGRDHVSPGQPHAAYNSNPPTSGPHHPDPLRWGVYDTPQPDEALVHNLEHGGIVVAYNCPDGCPALVEQLKDLVGQYRSKVVLLPRPNKDVPYRITLTAWTWLDGFDDFNAARIQAFIAAHKDRGPENVPDM